MASPLHDLRASRRARALCEAGGSGSGGVRVRRVAECDVPALAALYADACAPDPSYGALFHELGAEGARQALTWFFSRRLRLLLARMAASGGAAAAAGTLLLAEDAAGALIGGVGLLPPPEAAHSFASHWATASWAAAWLCAFGLHSLLRLLDLDRQYSAGLAKRPGEFELVMLAVQPASRRGGVGAALLSAALRAAPSHSQLVLGTNTTANARYYAARGWTLASTCTIAVRGAPRSYTQHVFRASCEDALRHAKRER